MDIKRQTLSIHEFASRERYCINSLGELFIYRGQQKPQCLPLVHCLSEGKWEMKSLETLQYPISLLNLI